MKEDPNFSSYMISLTKRINALEKSAKRIKDNVSMLVYTAKRNQVQLEQEKIREAANKGSADLDSV